ncbi:hypothetical protein OCH239_05920 [Roseivivax halodurans JCM 10272]|uniref:DUF4168 domain-containing protein n=1 Tax=Roseivivax halodurans JCM 10272 TaxID=1449350 RepID=X7EDJ0_9RHOB|nr:DUF4168 domain-containing protein [Roseivivax halodurans]ETX13992.1 hypothetical protein OCH239_05920 [Roseivivax halodurans JCM 10272]
MFPTRKITAATLAAAIAAVPASFVAAQESSTGDMQTETQSQDEMQQSEQSAPATGDETTAQSDQQTPVFEDEQIEAFASAVMEVTEIRDQYASQLQGVEDEAQQKEIIEEANTEMRAAIEETEGLSFEDYMAINRAASMDEELNQKIAQRLQEMQSEDAG